MGTYQDLNLCRLSAIAISKHLWTHTELRNSLKTCLHKLPEHMNTVAPLIKKIVDNFFLPEPVQEELMLAIGLIGYHMAWTFQHFQSEFKLETEENSHCTIKGSPWMEYISFRADGSPNESEIVRFLYFAGLFGSNYAAWAALSVHCLEDCLNDLWPKMGNIVYYYYYYHQSVRVEIDGFFSNYWIARMQNNLQDIIDWLQISREGFYDPAFSIEENMFISSMYHSQYAAAQYFWGSLNDNQRRRSISKICEKIRSDYPEMQLDEDFFLVDYQTDNHCLMFFLQQLSFYGFDEMKIELLKSGVVLQELMYWPYDDSFMGTLREMSTHHNFIDFGPVLSYIFESIQSEWRFKELNFVNQDFRYRRTFYWIWNANLPNLKSSIDYKEGLEMLWRSEDLELLDYILGDEELKDRREEFLKGLGEIVYRDEVDSVFYSNFMSKVLVSEEERKLFKRSIPSAK